MFGSQGLETAIGLALMFFVLAAAASAVTEVFSRIMQKRARDFEATLLEMLTAPAPHGRESRRAREQRLAGAKDFFALFKATSVWQAAEAASGRSLLRRRKVGNSYLSAKSFADAVNELVMNEEATRILDQVPSLKKRLAALVNESKRDFVDVKAGLESWFDETMSRAEGAYKRWASLVLFVVGLFLAVGFNASTTNVAQDLWQSSTTRAAVVEAANNVRAEPGDISSVADATAELDALQLPVGWDVDRTDGSRPDNPVDFVQESSVGVAAATIAGWVLTALLVMLGAPFWFDLLTRLVALRSTGRKPPLAADDDTSATTMATVASRVEPALIARSAQQLERLRVRLNGASLGTPPPMPSLPVAPVAAPSGPAAPPPVATAPSSVPLADSSAAPEPSPAAPTPEPTSAPEEPRASASSSGDAKSPGKARATTKK